MKTKYRIPLVIAIPVIAIGGCLGLSLVKLFVGTAMYNNYSHEYMDADRIAKAFSDYPKAHDGRYPTFRGAEDVTAQLEPLLAKEAAKTSDSGHQYTTLTSLESNAKRSIWNESLSGAKANESFDAPVIWVFYFPAAYSPNRFVVGYSDGKFTNKDKSQLPEIFGNQSKN